MTTISLTLPDCWPLPHALVPRDIPKLSCLGVDDIAANEVKPGGRVVMVTPYDPDNEGDARKICSGQYGQWQVLTGLGGQIHRGLYVGKSFQKSFQEIPANREVPGISSTVDPSDCCVPGDKCIAIRDRGRWYISKLGSSSASQQVIAIIGGNAKSIGNGIEGIVYSDPSVDDILDACATYDPDVTTEYIDGVGNGILFIDGVEQENKVLVRHNFFGTPYPALQGALVRVANTTTVHTINGDKVLYGFDWM